MFLKYKYNDIKEIIVKIALFVFILLLCMQCELSVFSKGISGIDSSVFRYVAYNMMHGGVPYRDTFDHKGPLIYFIDYIGMSIHFTKGIWLIELLMLFVGILYSYKTIQLFSSKLVAFLSVITAYSFLGVCLKGGNMTEEYAIPFITVSLYIFIKYLLEYKVKKIELILCGVCFASVCFLRVNMISVWIVCILIILVQDLLKRQWKVLGNQILFFSTGCLMVTIPILFYLIINQALLDFWNTYFIFNLSYSGHEELYNRIESYEYFIDQPLVYLAVLGLVYIGYAFYIKKSNFKINKWAFSAIIGCFLVTFPFMCMSGRNDITYAMILIPVLVVPIGYFYMFLLDIKYDGKTSVIAFFVIFYIVSEIMSPYFLESFHRGLEQNKYLVEYGEDEEWLEEIKNIVNLNCDESDTISVFGNKDIIYLLCDRQSASRYSYQFPIVTIERNIFQRYLEDLNNNEPKVIVIDYAFAGEYEDIFKQWLIENTYECIDSEETIFIKS